MYNPLLIVSDVRDQDSCWERLRCLRQTAGQPRLAFPFEPALAFRDDPFRHRSGWLLFSLLQNSNGIGAAGNLQSP
jgi:hypothetical protein